MIRTTTEDFPHSPAHAPSARRRPKWHYALGGCGCLSVAAVIGLIVIVLGMGSLLKNAPKHLAGSEKDQARARQTAERFLDLANEGDGDAAWALTSPHYQDHSTPHDFLNLLSHIQLLTRGQHRTFDTVKGGLHKNTKLNKTLTNVRAIFSYRSKSSDEVTKCVVYLIDPAELDDKVQSKKKFEVLSAACGPEAELKKWL